MTRAIRTAMHKLAVAIHRSGPGLMLASGKRQPDRRVRRAEARLQRRIYVAGAER